MTHWKIRMQVTHRKEKSDPCGLAASGRMEDDNVVRVGFHAARDSVMERTYARMLTLATHCAATATISAIHLSTERPAISTRKWSALYVQHKQTSFSWRFLREGISH